MPRKKMQMEYQVTITEILSRTEKVEAASALMAKEMVRRRYAKEDIVLDYSDFKRVDFCTSDSLYFKSTDRAFTLLHGDCTKLLNEFEFKFDMIFADPPYFLSNGGISVQSGRVVCVDKGEWDKGGTPEHLDSFNREWISLCRNKLKDNGTIWISGTYHNIFSVANALADLGFKILNVVTWAKTNPPPNISCRYFTYSTEFIIWARKCEKIPHYYNYELMKQVNENKQMTDVWRLPAISPWEKKCGKHPTQKPLSVLSRIILASTKPGAWILDPFSGSSTTGIAANLLGRRFLGIDKEIDRIYLNFSDPWPKNRHSKRRLTSHTLLSKYDNIFKGEKIIMQKTDNIDLFAFSIESLKRLSSPSICLITPNFVIYFKTSIKYLRVENSLKSITTFLFGIPTILSVIKLVKLERINCSSFALSSKNITIKR